MNQVCRYENECWVRPHGRTLSREEWNSLNVFEKHNLIMSVPMTNEDRRQYAKDGTYADDKMTHRQRVQYLKESPPRTYPPLVPKLEPPSNAAKLENLIMSKSLEVDYDKLIELAEAQAIVAKTPEAENARYKAKAKAMVSRLGERDTAESRNAEKRAAWWHGISVGLVIVAVANFIVGMLATNQPDHALGITATVIVAVAVVFVGSFRAHSAIKRGLHAS